MSTQLARPEMFRAEAMTANSLDWMVDGVHVRVKVHPWIGFPIHPFAAWRLREFGGQDKVEIVWSNRDGKAVTMPFDIESEGGELFGTIIGTSANPWIWIELEVNDNGVRIDLLDGTSPVNGAPRIIATRSREPFRFGNCSIVRLRVTGSGEVTGASGRKMDGIFLEELAERKPDFTFGLPLPTGPWYAQDPNDDPRNAAEMRVKFAAASILNPPDDPTGPPYGGTTPGDETDRLMRTVAPELVDPWLDEAFNDPGRAPVDSVLKRDGSMPNGKKLTGSAPVTSSLLTMAVDPQIARYLGLATTIDFGETPPLDPANIWLIASRWAVQVNRPVLRYDDPAQTTAPLGAFLQAAAFVPGFIDSALDQAFPDAPGIIAGLPNLPDRNGFGPWTDVTLLAAAVAPGDAPPDPPDAFALAEDEPGSWNAPDDPDNPAPESWRQSISLGDQPARGMVGFARMSPGTPEAVHQFVPERGDPMARALPLVPNWASNNRRVITDRTVPPDPSGATWQVWQADAFGQWSPGAMISLPMAARPAPPSPVVESTYSAFPDDLSTGKRVPGTIHLRIGIPDTPLLAPGGLPVAALELTVDGVAQPQRGVAPGDLVELDVSPRSFALGEQRQVPIVATFFDDAGTSSPESRSSCGVFDARAPRFIPTSPVVIWTGQADATGNAELALTWPPRDGATRYRVYMGDMRRLANDAQVALSGNAVRAANANPIHTKSSSFGDRHLFTFLGEVTTAPGTNAPVRFTTQIPGGLRSLQFVRIVPLTQGGAEASFVSCGLVPVAIPGADRPQTPIVEAATDLVNGVTLTIRARGLRKELVEAGAGKPPEFRLRRTRKIAADRGYTPVVPGGGALAGPDANGDWSATVTTPAAALDPFVRYAWFAETRYPAEPPIPPGATPLPVDGGVEPVWTVIGDAAEMLWSEPSLAVETLLIPASPPDPPLDPLLAQGANGEISMFISDLPIASPGAIGPYQLEIYRAKGGSSPELASPPLSGSAEITWNDPAPITPGEFYLLVIVDPIGRRSAPRRVNPL